MATINGTAGNDTLDGTTGADSIYGLGGNDTLNGNAGDDELVGGAGADTLNGGDGNDALFAGDYSPNWQPYYSGVTPVLDRGTEVDTLNGGAGFDYLFAGYGDNVDGGADGASLLISLAGSGTGLTVDFSKLDNGGTLTIGGGLIQNITQVQWIEGTNFDDTITGSNSVLSLNGATTIYGMGGNDHIIAGANTGDIHGGDGNDTIESAYSNGANFTYYGDAGDDVITDTNSTGYIKADGGDGNDTMTLAGLAYGGNGNDIITAAVNTTYGLTAYGGAGDDTLTGGSLSVQPSVGLFANTLVGGDGADHITGGNGNDRLLTGGDANAIFQGESPADYVDSGTEHDVVSGGGGDDTIYAGFGDDVDGGTGTNSLSLSLLGSTSGVTLNTADIDTGNAYRLGGGTIANIQHVFELWGSNFDDVLTLADPAEVFGGAGNDVINGSSGLDQIHGGPGADIINAGDGNDVIWIDAAGDAPTGEQINGGQGTDALMVGYGGNGGHISIADASLNSVETLSDTIGTTVGVTQTQISELTTILANVYFTDAGPISLAGKEGNGQFELNPAGNQLDLSGFTEINGSAGIDAQVAGSDSADSVIGGSARVVFQGNGGNDVMQTGDGGTFFVGGSGDDTLISAPHSGEVDITGGAGNDTLIGTAADLNHDAFMDFSMGDKIVITDADIANFTFSLSGSTLTYTGGTLKLLNAPTGRIVASSATGGGVQLSIVPASVHDDFNGDGRSDLLLRDSTGQWLTEWLGTPYGGIANNGANATLYFGADWHIAGTGDFNGDGRADFLLRSDAGWTTDWLGNANGSFTNNGANASLLFSSDWHIVGTGDFNGDGRTDLLLRSDAGWTTDWLGTPSGGFTNNGANASIFFDSNWQIVATGDFNGDGKSDFLLRDTTNGWITNWLGNASGGFTNNGANATRFFSSDWHVIGTGDFNADGRTDLLLRSDAGWVTDWLGFSNGGFTNNGANASLFLTSDWKVAEIGDINGDGREDIVLHNDNGWTTDWLGTATGGFTNNGANFSVQFPTNWHIQDQANGFL